MSERQADGSWVALPGVATSHMKSVAAALRDRRPPPRAIAALIAVAPLAVGWTLVWADAVWPFVLAGANAATAALYGDFEAVRANPGRVVDLIAVAFAAALAALPPALGIGAFERRLAGKALSAAAFYPGWFVVMLAPGCLIHHQAGALDPALMGAHLATHFLTLFSAAAASIALGYSLLASRTPAISDRIAYGAPTRGGMGLEAAGLGSN